MECRRNELGFREGFVFELRIGFYEQLRVFEVGGGGVEISWVVPVARGEDPGGFVLRETEGSVEFAIAQEVGDLLGRRIPGTDSAGPLGARGVVEVDAVGGGFKDRPAGGFFVFGVGLDDLRALGGVPGADPPDAFFVGGD